MRQFKTESKKLLDLMINSIYTNKEIFLRELISNASDAVDKLNFKSLQDPSVKLDQGDLAIRVSFDKDARTITISDNGIGMTAEELERNLGPIAHSGSEEFKTENAEQQGSDVDIIGHSEQENYRYDYDLVTKAFARNHKVVELNGNSFNVRRDGIPNMRALLRACLANGCHISVDSDAHSTHQLQHGLTALYAMLEEMQFPQELIVNATRENLVQELQLHGKPCAEEIGGILL